MRRVKMLMASLILIPMAVSSCGQVRQTGDYPPLVKKDFTHEEVYEQYKNEKYYYLYYIGKTIPTYEEVVGEPREEALPWEIDVEAGKVLEYLNTHLELLIPESEYEQRYITCMALLPETIAEKDIQELLEVELLDYSLTDAGNNKIAIDPSYGLSLIFSHLFEGRQSVLIRMTLAEGSEYRDIAGGHVNLRFSLASGFDKMTLDPSQRNSTVGFDGEQVELIEMEHNTVHLKLAASAAERIGEWNFIPCNNKSPMRGGHSYTEYPTALYEYARKNRGMEYPAFAQDAAANEEAWEDVSGGFYLVVDFDCPVTSLYIYRPRYTSVEKRVEI